MELNREQKIECLKYVLFNIQHEQKAKCISTLGMCYYLSVKLKKILNIFFVSYSEIRLLIPEFKKPDKDKMYGNYFFPTYDFDSRINYLKNLIKNIENGK